MKAEILALLRERGGYLSGQELCERFGVSRTAVWKAVNQLKKEGYHIEAVKNKGYILLPEDEVFGQNELESRMKTEWAGHPVTFYSEIGSTNVQAKLDAENGAPHGALLVADMQTAGRGRRGRTWNSPAGINVYFTLILKPDYAPDKASMVTLLMALGVAEGIRETCGIEAGIKWPNDIVVNGRKVCGILTEMSVEREFIHYATSLEAECGKSVSKAALVANTMRAFEKYYEKFQSSTDLSGVLAEYNGLLVNRGREVRVLDPKGEFQGVAQGINSTGELLVSMEDGSVSRVYAGEVSVRGIYGYV